MIRGQEDGREKRESVEGEETEEGNRRGREKEETLREVSKKKSEWMEDK